MTKQGILRILIHQAQNNGFEFRRWYQAKIDPSSKTMDEAIHSLAGGRRYYALLFSHDFARCFWKTGSKMSFLIPSNSYTKRLQDGHFVTVTRKAYTRRTIKADAWKFHIREMAVHEDPLRYIRRFLNIEEDLAAANASIDRTAPEGDSPPEPPAALIEGAAVDGKLTEEMMHRSVPLPDGVGGA